MSQGKKTAWDVWALPTFGDRKPIPVVVSPFLELDPKFSPDGRFLAYQSNESGRFEIYVQTFPGAGGKWQVSTSGGVDASWRADGKELFYRAADQKLMAVDIQAGSSFQAGIPRAALSGAHPDGYHAQQIRGLGRRPALPLRCASRTRGHRPDDRRPELERRARSLTQKPIR